MAEFRKNVDKVKNLTIMSAFGEVLVDQITEAIDQFYLSEYTLNLIWDFSSADVSSITKDNIYIILECAKKYAHLGEGGKAAFVMPNEFSYGMGRMYEILAEIKGIPINLYVSRSFNEAMSWMQGTTH
jgi:hypothetical protein